MREVSASYVYVLRASFIIFLLFNSFQTITVYGRGYNWLFEQHPSNLKHYNNDLVAKEDTVP